MASRPDGDVWNIVDNDVESQHYGRNFKFDFSYISSEKNKDVVKDYIWQNYRVRNISLNTLYTYLNSYLMRFFGFVENENKELSELSNADIDRYVSLLHATISKRTRKPLGYQSQKKTLDAVKGLIRWCQLHRPNDVPMIEIFTGNEYIGVNRKLKIDFIPDDVVAQINEALKTEKNPYLKCGIIILH